MKHQINLKAFLSILSFCFAGSTLADAKHGIAMYGEPDLPQDFVSLPYVNLDAPQGGRLVFGLMSSILKSIVHKKINTYLNHFCFVFVFTEAKQLWSGVHHV